MSEIKQRIPELSNADVLPKPTASSYWLELHTMKVRAALAAHCGYNISFDGQHYYCLGSKHIGIDNDLSVAMDKAFVPDYATDWDASYEAMIAAMKQPVDGGVLVVNIENSIDTKSLMSLVYDNRSLIQQIDVLLNEVSIFRIERIDPDSLSRVALFIFEASVGDE